MAYKINAAGHDHVLITVFIIYYNLRFEGGNESLFKKSN